MPRKRLIILLGATASGKTEYSLELASRYGSPIISCDSRQIYKEMSIGTAVPDQASLEAVKHYFIQDHSIENLYTAGLYEMEALELIRELFSRGHDTLVMTGGSCFYIDAVCKGLDDFPCADQALRAELDARCREEGVDSLARQLQELDPESCKTIDIKNNQRVIRALEVCLMTGRPFSSFKTGQEKKREFDIVKLGLQRDREELYGRIDKRVDLMMEAGLEQEALSLYDKRGLAALQTVGYKELFGYFDGQYSKEEAVRLIKRNTRHYARRQLSWWRRDELICWGKPPFHLCF